MIKIRCVRFIYLGLPRSGKTTFLLRLLGDILNITSEGKYMDGKERPSTGVAKDEGMAVTNWGIAGEKWSRIKGFKNEADILTQFINQLVIPDGSETPQEIDMGNVLSFLDGAIESEDWNTIEYVLKDMTLMINTDTGGHAEFLDLHSSLVHGPSLNLLFSSLKDSLHDYFNIRYTDENGKSTEPVDSDMTVEEVLFQALSSIACFGCSKRVEGGTSKVMFVGTHAHKDEVSPEDFDKKDRLLQNTIKATAFYDRDFIEFFSKGQLMLKVDNMKGDKEEMDEIRTCLNNVIKNSFKEIEIRASWLILSLYIRHTKEYQMSLKDCEKIASNLGIIGSADLKKALLFLHHNLGVLLYYPTIKELKDKVICNTQIVYDSATNLIKNSFTFKNVGEMAEERFKKKAMFTLECLKRVPLLDIEKKLSWDELVKLLEYLRIITPMPDQELTYFMPCHLKSARASDLKHSCGDSDPAPLLVHFTCGYVPTGVFPFMITWLVSQNFPEWRLIDEGMHKNMIKFQVGKDYDDVTLLSHPQYIEIAVKRRAESVSVCHNICSTVESILSKNSNLDELWNFGFECPKTHSEPTSELEHDSKLEDPDSKRKHICVYYEKGSTFMKCILQKEIITLQPRHKVWFSCTLSSPSTIAIDEAKLGSVQISYQEYYYNKTFDIVEHTTCGSGFAVDDECILTNAHVVSNTDIVNVKLDSGKSVRGDVTDIDELADLAIVKFKLPVDISITPLEFADSDSVTVMQVVAAIGSPCKPMNSITTGTVNHLLRKYNDLGLPQDTDLKYFETDATIHHGNSGGPLLNLAGKVIGVVSTRFDTHKSFAIKSNDAEKFVNTAKKDVSQYTIGVTMLTPVKEERPAILEHFLLPEATKGGVVLMEVKDDSPASRAGLKREDFVFSINGQPISSAHDVYKMVRRGEPLNIEFYRINYLKRRKNKSVCVKPVKISDLQA